MIAVKLREAMERYRRRTGRRMTYRALAQATGVSEYTLQSISARPGYNTTLDTIDRIATALECPLAELLEQLPVAEEVRAIQRREEDDAAQAGSP